MVKSRLALMVMGLLVCGGTVHGQKATEIYIPIGRSPGLSGAQTIIGTVQAINAQDGFVAIAGPRRTWRIQLTDRTKIWLDRSALRMTNTYGRFADIEQGVMVEIKYEGRAREDGGRCEWMKCRETRRRSDAGHDPAQPRIASAPWISTGAPAGLCLGYPSVIAWGGTV